MKQKRSEIFESFAKIAIDQGLIEVNAESRTQEDKYKDSEYKKNIQNLYHIDLDKEDLLDLAHPKPVIISPSYDKINGLVENLKERHNIMVGIVNKHQGGNLLSEKYADAHDELLGELVRLGFSMDNKKIDNLRILADDCSNRITKKALFGIDDLVIGGGIAAVLGLIAIINHTTPSDQGVFNNCEKAIIEIKELRPKLPQIGKNIDSLLTDLQFLQNLSKNYNDLDGIDASTPEKLVDAAKQNKDKLDLVKKYKSSCAYMAGEINQYVDMIKSYKANDERSYDWWQRIKNVTEYITGDDKQDAVLALQTLQKSLQESVTEANEFMGMAKQQAPGLIAYYSNHAENTPDSNSMPKTQHNEPNHPQNAQVSNHPSIPEPKEDEDLDQSIWDINPSTSA